MRNLLIGLVLASAGAVQAASVTLYTDLASWQAAVGGAVQTQDFSGYATGTDLTGTDVLPGVTLSSNLGPVRVFGAAQTAFASGARNVGDAYYESAQALPFRAMALDITSFESIPGDGSTAVDSGLLSFLFSDGGDHSLSIAGGDGSPIFIGIISDSAITSFRWTEAHEASGGNEESGLDNLRVALRGDNTVPLPGTLALVLLALAGVGARRVGRQRD